jgi:serine protease Do
MANLNRTGLPVLIAIGLVAAVTVGAVILLPDIAAQLSYAVERGQADAARENLGTATGISSAFRGVAKTMQPSVVSITSVKRFQPSQRGGRRRLPQLPEEFRDFFGDDGLDRFFQFPIPEGGFQQQGLGSGVIVSEDGYVLTNNHVVRDADEVSVILTDGRRFTAEVIGTDAPTDLAVLKVDASGLVPATLGDSSEIDVGQWVLAVGSPMGLDQTVTVGIVSAKGRGNVGISDYEDFIQTDAAINPGNSGGPLVNLEGEVIGINTAIASRTGGNMGIGFAIPSNMARDVKDAIINEGKVQRGRIGAMIQNLTPDLAKSFDYDSTKGVLVGDVIEDSPADQAGLKSGDIVVEYNGKAVNKAYQLRNAVAGTAPGSEGELEVFRNGKYRTVEITIGRLEDQPSLGQVTPGAEAGSELGMTLKNLTPELRQQLGLGPGEKGVVVVAVQPGGLASREGIRKGDLVIGVGNTPISDVASFRSAMEEHDLDQGVRLRLERDGMRRFVFLRRRS